MSESMRPYDEYKDSGLAWLGKIPAHWNLLRAKYVMREVDERSITGGETHLTMSQVHGLIDSSKFDKHRLQSESYAGGKLCRTDDLVLNRLKAHLGVFAHAPQEGVVSPDYTVFRLIRDNEIRFFEYLFKTPTYIAEFRRATKGIVEGFWRLYTDDFYDIRVPVPTQPEQRSILRWVKLLDDKLRRFVRNKRRLIKLLTEQKQVIISRAVMRGLDPDVRLKPSRINWLGDVPEHWEVVALRHRYTIELGKMLDGKRITGAHLVPYLRNIDVQWDCINSENLPMMDIKESEYSRYTLQCGDMLVCEGGEVGRAAFWKGELSLCGFQKALHRLRPLNALRDTARFLYYILFAASKRGVFAADGNENTIAHLTGEKLRAHRFAFPLKQEQDEIVAYIDNAVADVEAAIIRTNNEIKLIREYRTRLIADVVTGKVDVRHLAPEGVELTLDETEVLEDASDLLLDEEAEDLEASEEEATLAED